MSEHTKGLLTVGGEKHDDWGLIRGGDGKPLATAAMECRIPEHSIVHRLNGTIPPEIAANARRLVACWNHCGTFSNDTIEAGPDMAELVQGWSDAEKLRAVNAELLAAIKELYADQNGPLTDAIKQAQAAIAKAERADHV